MKRGRSRLVVVALGGNALLRRGEPLEAHLQLANIRRAARSIAELTAHGDVIVTHGNGPQVGLLALQAEAYRDVGPYPLDVLGAETEGMIGYLLEQALRNALPQRAVATVLTQVAVDAADPAFANPNKPIGPVYTKIDADQVAAQHGWTIMADGDGFRRVVPSPEPQRIIELRAIEVLLRAGLIVICVGGGGVPVIAREGALDGVEAVIDKDLSAALLAAQLRADFLLLLTDARAVERNWGSPQAEAIHEATPAELRRLNFERGSMAPKVEAACRFVEARGGVAAIGALNEAAAIVEGRAGTRVVP